MRVMRRKSQAKVDGAGRVIAGRYRLQAPLGRGGMGTIWSAEHVKLRSRVAIKFLDASIADDPEMLERFLREAQSAAAVRSSHVVQIFDCGVDEREPYIAMELLQGETLDERLTARGRLTPAELDQIFSQVAAAVGNAHQLGVIHRDLKPANIFLAREGELEVTKVLDFGIAKVMNHSLQLATGTGTRTGALLGTPSYMSPEQARGSRDLDQGTDLWSLAIIAFECLTGQQPFAGKTIGDLVVQICTEPPCLPSRLSDVPCGFDAWFLKGVSKSPAERFGSAREMATTLREVLAHPSAPVTQSMGWRPEPPPEMATLHSGSAPPTHVLGPSSLSPTQQPARSVATGPSSRLLSSGLRSASRGLRRIGSSATLVRLRPLAPLAALIAVLCGLTVNALWPDVSREERVGASHEAFRTAVDIVTEPAPPAQHGDELPPPAADPNPGAGEGVRDSALPARLAAGASVPAVQPAAPAAPVAPRQRPISKAPTPARPRAAPARTAQERPKVEPAAAAPSQPKSTPAPAAKARAKDPFAERL
jgi:serine/threonine protein kinase